MEASPDSYDSARESPPEEATARPKGRLPMRPSSASLRPVDSEVRSEAAAPPPDLDEERGLEGLHMPSAPPSWGREGQEDHRALVRRWLSNLQALRSRLLLRLQRVEIPAELDVESFDETRQQLDEERQRLAKTVDSIERQNKRLFSAMMASRDDLERTALEEERRSKRLVDQLMQVQASKAQLAKQLRSLQEAKPDKQLQRELELVREASERFERERQKWQAMKEGDGGGRLHTLEKRLVELQNENATLKVKCDSLQFLETQQDRQARRETERLKGELRDGERQLDAEQQKREHLQKLYNETLEDLHRTQEGRSLEKHSLQELRDSERARLMDTVKRQEMDIEEQKRRNAELERRLSRIDEDTALQQESSQLAIQRLNANSRKPGPSARQTGGSSTTQWRG
ncbi:unnamed protein product [Vitrella brassicaformis CCMP3155]|uniref:Uncharacterized protein n=2 Tax=Vitrella brassicaformis TaxID=1169539 RepID=A0A0G4FJ79_VITBC|nr:unnamed protein product [Vitrella brassicaformis CCMP3155]|eukprot:CEM13787.1 unnamed protein product [Vitrella brassicaformis CCMP3155]